jgi:hypothetical protein
MFRNDRLTISRPMIHLALSTALAVSLHVPGWPQAAPAADNPSTPPANAAAASPASNPAPEAPADAEAVISDVQGVSVQVSLDNGQTWQKATKGIKVSKNGAIRTGFASSCELSFGGRSVLQIQALSSIKVADYQTSAAVEKVRTNLQYGAVRCGVEKGRVTADTAISTPVATIAIRGTITFMAYDPGTQRCELGVDQDGPALASSAAGQYTLYEGMRTNETLSRFLRLAIFDRTVWLNGNYRLGEISETEALAIAYQAGNDTAIDPTEGALQFNDPKSIDAQRVSESFINNCPGGICD